MNSVTAMRNWFFAATFYLTILRRIFHRSFLTYPPSWQRTYFHFWKTRLSKVARTAVVSQIPEFCINVAKFVFLCHTFSNSTAWRPQKNYFFRLRVNVKYVRKRVTNWTLLQMTSDTEFVDFVFTWTKLYAYTGCPVVKCNPFHGS